MIKNPNPLPWRSSYEQNHYGEFFYSLIRIYQPEKIVELGTLAGYSAYHIARGLKANGKGTLTCYDLWEDYKSYSVSKSEAEANLKEFQDIVELNSRNVIDVDELYETVDILHVDVDNEGEILEKIIPNWIGKVSKLIIIEGGSIERDTGKWIKPRKILISKWLKDFSRRRKIEYVTIEPYPSITLIRKK